MVDSGTFTRREDYLDDVEAACGRIASVAGQVEVGEMENLPFLGLGDRCGRGGEGVIAAALHLDEYQDLAVPGQQVDLPAPDAEIAREDPKAPALEMARGDPLPAATEAGAGGESAREGAAQAAQRPCEGLAYRPAQDPPDPSPDRFSL